MNFDKVFTEKESTALLNKCMLRYDPGNFSFKPRLICGEYRQSLQGYSMNFSTEWELFRQFLVNSSSAISVTNSYFEDMFGLVTDFDENQVLKINPSNNAHCSAFIHRNNYYMTLGKVMYLLHQPSVPTMASGFKTTRIYEALTTLMVALTHYKSLVPHLKWLCNVSTENDNFYDSINLKKLSEATTNGGTVPDKAVMIGYTNMTVPFMIGTDVVSNSLETPDTAYAQMFYEFVVFSLEIFNRIESIKDSELKKALYDMIISNTTGFENKIVDFIYTVDINTNEIVFTQEALGVITIEEPETRYYAIRDFARKLYSEYSTARKELVQNMTTRRKGVNNFLAEVIKFCQNESIMNIRVKTLYILYEYAKQHKLLNNISQNQDSMPLPGSVSAISGDMEMPETFSMMNLDEGTPIDTQMSENALKKHAPERPPAFEELDKLNAKFKAGGYTYNVKDIVSTNSDSKIKYDSIASHMSLLNKNLIRSIKDIKVYNSGGKNPGKKTGKIDRKNLYKYKTSKDIFFDNTYKIKECDLAFGIILDASGSMRGDGVRNGISTLIVLHETLKALNINHSIITHNSTNYHSCKIERFQCFKEDKPYQPNKNYALTEVTARSCNCDSGALYYMEQAFRRVKNKDKICIIFSDGEPTECSDTDLKEQVVRMEKLGIKVIGIGIGFPNIKEYYKDNANGSSLKEMFDIVSNILKQYVLEKVDE